MSPESEHYEDYHPTDSEYDAAFNQVARYTWDLIDSDNHRANTTAVAVRVGNRHFLATCAHFIRHTHAIQVGSRRGGFQFRSSRGFANRTFDDGPLDIGLLELSAEQTKVIADFVDEKHILTCLDESVPEPVVVSGFPSVMHVRTSRSTMAACPMNLHSETVPPSALPKSLSELDNPPVAGRDLFIAYSEEGNGQFNTRQQPFAQSSASRVAAPHPGGLSGAGIWLVHFACKKVSGIVYPDVKLLGIQHGWIEKRQLLRGTLIDHWLDLVAEKYPDLGEVVSDMKARTRVPSGKRNRGTPPATGGTY